MLDKFVYKKIENPHQITQKDRETVGNLASYTGIIINVCLALAKIIAGLFFSSISILADGFNNLSDTGNSIISLVSFKLSNKPADKNHPFGHERIEYVASLAVGILILLLSIELFQSSITKVITPTAIEFSFIIIVVLILSIIAKLWMYRFYNNCAQMINSTVLIANAKDSLNDVFATSAIIVSTLASHFLNIQLDGIMGLVVAVIIALNGYNILKDAMNKIIGEAPSKEFVTKIEQKIKSYEGVYGFHDLMIHSYGSLRCFASVHVEVDSRVDILISHDLIDNIEQDFLKNEGIHVVIHVDPIVLDNPILLDLREKVSSCILELSSEIETHDYRLVVGPTHLTVVFDCVIPYHVSINEKQVLASVENMLANLDTSYSASVNFERPYNT